MPIIHRSAIPDLNDARYTAVGIGLQNLANEGTLVPLLTVGNGDTIVQIACHPTFDVHPSQGKTGVSVTFRTRLAKCPDRSSLTLRDQDQSRINLELVHSLLRESIESLRENTTKGLSVVLAHRFCPSGNPDLCLDQEDHGHSDSTCGVGNDHNVQNAADWTAMDYAWYHESEMISALKRFWTSDTVVKKRAGLKIEVFNAEDRVCTHVQEADLHQTTMGGHFDDSADPGEPRVIRRRLPKTPYPVPIASGVPANAVLPIAGDTSRTPGGTYCVYAKTSAQESPHATYHQEELRAISEGGVGTDTEQERSIKCVGCVASSSDGIEPGLLERGVPEETAAVMGNWTTFLARTAEFEVDDWQL